MKRAAFKEQMDFALAHIVTAMSVEPELKAISDAGASGWAMHGWQPKRPLELPDLNDCVAMAQALKAGGVKFVCGIAVCVARCDVGGYDSVLQVMYARHDSPFWSMIVLEMDECLSVTERITVRVSSEAFAVWAHVCHSAIESSLCACIGNVVKDNVSYVAAMRVLPSKAVEQGFERYPEPVTIVCEDLKGTKWRYANQRGASKIGRPGRYGQ